MEAAGSLEMLKHIYQSTWHYIRQDSIFKIHCIYCSNKSWKNRDRKFI